MATTIQLRRDTLANWTANNPVLAEGELGVELVSNKFKVGNGTSTWTALSYAGSVGTVTSVAALTLGTTGTDVSSTVATGTTTPVITLNIPNASASARGALTSTDWSAFNGKYSVGGALGTPSSGTLTSCTGLPVSTGISGLAAGAATFLATPSSANLAALITDETGTGLNVFATSPSLSTPTITGTKETKIAMGANAIDLATGNYFTKTISAATAFTVSNVPAAGTAVSFILDLTNGGAGTITWWAGMKWVGGTAPTLTTAGRDSLGFFTHDGGTTWTGLVLGKDIK